MATAELRLEISDLKVEGLHYLYRRIKTVALFSHMQNTGFLLTRHTNHDSMELGVLPLLNIPHDNEWLQENEHIG